MKSEQEIVNDLSDGFTADQLKKVYAILFDVWCWDSENDHLKRIVDALQNKIENDTTVSTNNNGATSQLTYAANGVRKELFKLEYGLLSLGSDLEMAISQFIATNLLNNVSSSGFMHTELMNQINNSVMVNPVILSLQSDISALRDEIEQLKEKTGV